MPYALTLGVVVAIGDLVPLVGATLASIIVVATAYFTQGTTAAIIVFVVVMVYQQIENHVIQPIVYRHTVQIPSLVVLIAVLAGASVLGIVGALVAIPIAGTRAGGGQGSAGGAREADRRRVRSRRGRDGRRLTAGCRR